MAKTRLCEVAGCGKKHWGKGFCQKHLHKFHKYGNPLAGRTSTEAGAPLAFLRDLIENERKECVYWPYATVGKYSYGGVYYEGRQQMAHRVGCIWLNGPAPSDVHEAAHNCGQGREGCVNPYHTRWATPKENTADQLVHGTRRRGIQMNAAKLTPELVRALRSDMAGGGTERPTAAKYGVSRRNLRAIVNGDHWCWVD